MANKLVEEYKELFIEQLKKDLVNEGFEINEVIDITNDLNEHFEEDLLEKTILEEVVPIEEKGTGGEKTGKTFGEKIRTIVTKAGKDTDKRRGVENRNLDVVSKKDKKGVMAKVGEFVSKNAKAIGIGLALAGAAFLLYKAIKRKFDTCAKTCKGDKKCLYNCKINYQKGLISVLKKNEQELKKEGKLTDKRKAAIDKAINKAKEKIKKYQEQLKNLK